MAIIDTILLRAERMPSSKNGNPKYRFITDNGTYTTMTDAMCAYKGMPSYGPIIIRLDNRDRIIDYGWPAYPMGI